jgi:hypothetical protein
MCVALKSEPKALKEDPALVFLFFLDSMAMPV